MAIDPLGTSHFSSSGYSNSAERYTCIINVTLNEPSGSYLAVRPLRHESNTLFLGNPYCNYIILLLLSLSLLLFLINKQRAKKAVSDSPGLVDFAIRLVKFVLNLPDGQVKFLRNPNYRRTVTSILLIKTFGLVYASPSLPEWQGVKITFFAP